jgi:hypothetical protein
MSRPRRSDLLELQLLRKGLGALTRDRHACADCGRTPLPGERVHLYAGDALVCALCRPLRREEPVDVDVVRHTEHERTVRRLPAAA